MNERSPGSFPIHVGGGSSFKVWANRAEEMALLRRWALLFRARHFILSWLCWDEKY